MKTEKDRENQEEVCRLCKGHKKCPTCAGKGVWYDWNHERERCSSCRGFGWCPECSGSGKAKSKQI